MRRLHLGYTVRISIHSLLAEGDAISAEAVVAPTISIHSLLAEGDPALSLLFCDSPNFNPLPPRGGRR